MISDFEYLRSNYDKVQGAIGSINSKMLLKGIRKFSGKNSKVFYEHSVEETKPIFGGRTLVKSNFDRTLVLIEPSPGYDGIVLLPYNIDDIKSPYPLDYMNDYCMPKVMNSLNRYRTKRYFSVDLEYILSISAAFDNLDFTVFSGEAERILKAWLHVMTHGVLASDGKTIMLQSSKNEYGNDVGTRVLVRNSSYVSGSNDNNIGAPYAQSIDPEWALSGDDYSKVQCLNTVFTALAKGNDLLYSKPIVSGIIKDISIDRYGDPQYLSNLLNVKDAKLYKKENME